VSNARRRNFVVEKPLSTLPDEILNDPLLKHDFSQPTILDTKSFHLLNYGTNKIYDSIDCIQPEVTLTTEKKITHLQAESLQAQLHNKFRARYIRDSISSIEEA